MPFLRCSTWVARSSSLSTGEEDDESLAPSPADQERILAMGGRLGAVVLDLAVDSEGMVSGGGERGW